VVEESQGVALAAELSAEGYLVTVYDPMAMDAAEAVLGDRVIFANDVGDALATDVVVVTTPWSQFKDRKLLEGATSKKLVIIDPWRIVSHDSLPVNVSLVRMGFGKSA